MIMQEKGFMIISDLSWSITDLIQNTTYLCLTNTQTWADQTEWHKALHRLLSHKALWYALYKLLSRIVSIFHILLGLLLYMALFRLLVLAWCPACWSAVPCAHYFLHNSIFYSVPYCMTVLMVAVLAFGIGFPERFCIDHRLLMSNPSICTRNLLIGARDKATTLTKETMFWQESIACPAGVCLSKSCQYIPHYEYYVLHMYYSYANIQTDYMRYMIAIDILSSCLIVILLS